MNASYALPRAPSGASVTWNWARWAALGADDVYDFLALRSEVFHVEQHVAGQPSGFLDVDGCDRSAWHLLGRATDASSGSMLVTYLRLVDPGIKFREPSIGRVITRATRRGAGLGRALMREGLARAAVVWPHRPIRIGAQHRLVAFYASLGFAAVGEPYQEDGIAHIEMLHPMHDGGVTVAPRSRVEETIAP